MFKLFAELIAIHLNALERLNVSEASLARERSDAELREQFIAVLGHDLRNPLASIQAGVKLVRKAKSLEQAAELYELMQESILRMAKLVDNVLDFARGRLGGGLPVVMASENLAPLLQQVESEIRSVYPDSTIESHISVSQPVRCDRGRICQLFSNLLANSDARRTQQAHQDSREHGRRHIRTVRR
jgi:signal transduction histidine kinase